MYLVSRQTPDRVRQVVLLFLTNVGMGGGVVVAQEAPGHVPQDAQAAEQVENQRPIPVRVLEKEAADEAAEHGADLVSWNQVFLSRGFRRFQVPIS